ncbi:MAG TPA: hypothetical protein VFU68_07030 [Terracidiphilus sp.]|nr:hypothetical protein [Terracidiphilus sp.]
MTLRTCPRERELAALLHRGHWPHACPPELAAHVPLCRSCSDLLAVTLAFRQARAQSAAGAPLVSPGVLWWRAQLRRRNAALETIRKPILGAQLFAVSVVLAAASLALVTQAARGRQWIAWLAGLPLSLHLDSLNPSSLLPTALLPSSLGGFSGALWLLVPVLATLAIVGGLLVCFGSDKR